MEPPIIHLPLTISYNPLAWSRYTVRYRSRLLDHRNNSRIPNLEYRVTHDTKSILPIHHPQTTRLLGIAWMPNHPALLHPGRRRDDESQHLPARARARAVERGVCRAVCSPG